MKIFDIFRNKTFGIYEHNFEEAEKIILYMTSEGKYWKVGESPW